MQNAIAFRLTKGNDLYLKLKEKALTMNGGAIITCVGSLLQCRVRLAGAEPTNQSFKFIKGPLEIVSLVGTLSKDGIHIHISVSDPEGNVFGGHLTEGSIVDTTAEIVILDYQAATGGKEIFQRLPDFQTGFKELVISNLN